MWELIRMPTPISQSTTATAIQCAERVCLTERVLWGSPADFAEKFWQSAKTPAATGSSFIWQKIDFYSWQHHSLNTEILQMLRKKRLTSSENRLHKKTPKSQTPPDRNKWLTTIELSISSLLNQVCKYQMHSFVTGKQGTTFNCFVFPVRSRSTLPTWLQTAPLIINESRFGFVTILPHISASLEHTVAAVWF